MTDTVQTGAASYGSVQSSFMKGERGDVSYSSVSVDTTQKRLAGAAETNTSQATPKKARLGEPSIPQNSSVIA